MGWAAPAVSQTTEKSAYDQGVEYYRNGDYEKALTRFSQAIKTTPASTEAQYYYAITLAQLGRLKEAKSAYEAVIKMAPGTEAAQLAQQGIDYLPNPNDLDTPPHLQRSNNAAPSTGAAPNSQGTQQAQSPFGNMDPQAMQMMMMMGSMGGGGGSGFNPMMLPLMESLTHSQGGNNTNNPNDQDKMPPEAYSTMMMNQMMQDFSPFNSKDSN
jgi:tetratricopeptide (TPR) repeat protein